MLAVLSINQEFCFSSFIVKTFGCELSLSKVSSALTRGIIEPLRRFFWDVWAHLAEGVFGL